MPMNPNQVFWLAVLCVGGMSIGWGAVFISCRNHPAILQRMMEDGYALKILTAEFIIIAATILALDGKFSGEIATILSALAGYVFGSLPRGRKAPESTRT